MPVAIGYFAQRRRDFPCCWLLWLFAAFIMACGAAHLMGAIVIWQPLYGLDALLKAVTALIPVTTAVVLWPLIAHALKPAKEAVEDSLQNERGLMVAMVESSEDAIIGNTRDAIVASWNPAAEKMFGYAAAAIVGRPMRVPIPAERGEEEAMLFDSVRRGEPVKQFETVRVCQAACGQCRTGCFRLCGFA